MTTFQEIENLPDPLKQEILDFAEYVIMKHNVVRKKNTKWVDVKTRGESMNESASQTIVKMRNETEC